MKALLNLPFDPVARKFLVGLEIHQQLATSSKLFCSCPIVKSEEFPNSFERRLRPTQSELGHIDPAAVFEFNKGKVNVYKWNGESSCLVEADEEPPHPLNEDALDTSALMGLMFQSLIVDEVHVMRKIVIDGSNTSGFQRTAVVALGGTLRTNETSVGVQTITLEEDAARIVGEDERARYYALDRQGVPLVEISLDPIPGDPDVVESVALSLGRALRSTGRVARGLGTIRQDLNVSLMGGEVIEVKGVQRLNLLAKVIRYEAARQIGLVGIAEELKKRGVTKVKCSVNDITDVVQGTGSQILKKASQAGLRVYCVTARGLAGLLGFEPYPNVRLGKELAEIARANSLGGVIHSDEFRKQGISESEELKLRDAAAAETVDGLVLVAGEDMRAASVSSLIVERLEAAPRGVPSETRAATEDGSTRYMRPRPGAARLYPETDIPEIRITEEKKTGLKWLLPESWQTKVRAYVEGYGLSEELAQQLYDSEFAPVFDGLAAQLRLTPTIIASVLVEVPARLSREGIDTSRITPAAVKNLLERIERGSIAKEASVEILRMVGRGEAEDIQDAVAKLGLVALPREEMVAIIDKIIAANAAMIAEKGERAFSPLMGEVMKALRGKVDGALLSDLLRKRLSESTEHSLK